MDEIMDQSEAWERSSVATTIQMEEDYPRGGEELVTPLERRKIRHQAERDDLFGQMMFDDTPIAGESKVKRQEMKQEDIFTIKDKVIDHISPKYMTEGVLILGAVCAVHQYKMIMSLPFNMTGSVNIGDVSDPLAAKGDQFDESLELSQMFHVGQIFPCYVLSVDDKNHVMLSINPRLVNVHLTARTLYPNMLISGCIKSIEDHGYIVDFGIPDKNGFLLKTNASDYIKLHHDGNPLCVGQIITCHIPSIPDGSRSIPVSIPDQSNISFLPSDSSLFTLFSIIPGLPVNGVVKNRTPNGMIVYYLRGFEGVVNIHHLPLKDPLSLEKFTKKKIQGRVLWVDMLNKRSGLTLHTELVQNVGHQFTGMKIGTIFHDAEIILVEPHKGVVLSLPGGGRGFSPLRLMYDTKTDKVTKIHSLGSHHSCRVVQFNYIDGAAIVSLQESILEESLMTVDDVVTGSLVEGVVSKMIAKGANIRLGKHVFGFCPLDESHSKVTRRKFVEGQTVKFRVMFVDVPNQFVMLSCRRGLISSKLPPLLDIASAVVGQYYDGQIISVADEGIVVQFYNKITGFIPSMELCSSSAQVVLDPRSAFKFGQVITCRVVQIGERRLKLSLRVVGEATPTDSPKVSPGDILDLEVTGIMSGGLSLVHPTTKELIYLPTDALSDYPHHCHELLSFHSSQLSAATSRGSPYILHGVLMLTRGSSLSPAVGTLKKLLIQATTDGSYPKSFVEEKVGMILPGVVKRIYSYGCFIEFPNGLIGLAPIRLLSDDFISDAAGIYKPMQTVIAKVHDQDEEKERTLLSLRSSDLRLSLYKSSGSLSDILLKHFTNISQEKQLILSNTSGQCYKPGTIINAEVTSISMKYVHLSLDNGLHEGVAYRDPSYVEGLSPGGVVKCCILDWDIIDNHYWVTLNPLIFKETKVEKEKKKNISKKQLRYKSQFKLQVGHTVSAVVEHVTSYYFMCTASTLTGSTLAYGLFDTGQWGVIPSQLKHVKPGIRIDGTVISSSSTLLLNNSSSSTSSSDLPVILLGKSVKCNEFVSEQFNVTIGTIIEAKVLGRVANQLNVSYGPWRGRVHVTMVTDDPLENSFPANSYSPGDILKAKVIGFINAKAAQARIKSSGPTYLELTTRESLLTDDSLINDKSIQDAIHKDYVVGELVMGVIKKIFKKTMIVSLTPHLLMCVSNSLIPRHSKPIKKHYCSGQVVKCAVIECTRPRNKEVQYHGSMLIKSSLVGHIVEGVVSKILPYERLEVKLDGNVGGFVDVTDVSDHFIGNPLSYFNVGDKYNFYCLQKCSNGKYYLSLRQCHCGETPSCFPASSDGVEPDREISTINDIEEGLVLRGYIKAIDHNGAFVKLGRIVTGRVMICNLSDRYIRNYQSCYSQGELVRVKVIRVDGITKQVELSMKMSDVDPTESEGVNVVMEEKKTRKRKRSKQMEVEDGSSDDEMTNDDIKRERITDDDGNGDESMPVTEKKKHKRTDNLPPLPIDGGFNWIHDFFNYGSKTDEEEEEEEDGDDKIVKGKMNRRQKKAAKKAEEAYLYKKESLLLDKTKSPESADDFDKALVAEPNNSALWIQYMAFHLHTADIDKARSIAERGLVTISFREEQHKLNLWVGLMNLENLYGTKESLMKVFDRAVQHNDPLTIHMKLAYIFQSSDKIDLAEQLFSSMAKKFKSDLEVWIKYGTFLMENKRYKTARGLIQRSLTNLTKKRHVELIKNLAQCEFKYGDIERGCTMFENLIKSYPRRVDLWSIYIDMLTKAKEFDKVRDIFERAVNLKVSPKQMKFIFKRYMEFEKDHGTPALMAAVHEKAKAYVDSIIP